MRRNSAVPSLASDPNTPYPRGPVMRKSPNTTGSEPAASIAVPSRRADSVTVTGRVIPFSVSVAGCKYPHYSPLIPPAARGR